MKKIISILYFYNYLITEKLVYRRICSLQIYSYVNCSKLKQYFRLFIQLKLNYVLL